MALNKRGMDPRFVFHHRNVARGWMTARIEVLSVSAATPDIRFSSWDPLNPSYPEQGDPKTRAVLTPIFVGMGRIEPNKDWRARLMENDGAVSTWHAVRVQYDLTSNELTTTVMPGKGDQVHVLDCIDPLLDDYRFAVRNPLGTSNTWQRTLLCDAVVG